MPISAQHIDVLCWFALLLVPRAMEAFWKVRRLKFSIYLLVCLVHTSEKALQRTVNVKPNLPIAERCLKDPG